jgi:hypothetical protein
MTDHLESLDEIQSTLKQFRVLNERLTLLVRMAYADGASWRAIGLALGTSGQAAWGRYSAVVKAGTTNGAQTLPSRWTNDTPMEGQTISPLDD